MSAGARERQDREFYKGLKNTSLPVMPNVEKELLEKNVIKLTFTITQEEAQPYFEKAAERISQQTSIPGFRPGHADYTVVKQRVGEMKIMEEALESLVRKSFVETILAENIDTVGSPKVDVLKLAPGNDVVFTAEVTLMPKTKSLADVKKLSVKAQTTKVEEKEIDLALRDLQRMRTTEVRATAEKTTSLKDKVVIAMNMKLDNVPLEGGQSPNHSVYLNEEYYIPGFKEKLEGMKEGEEKSFTITFPKEHAQEFLAGKDVMFDITLKELYHLQPPELDDAFAAMMGTKDMTTLREIIGKNLLTEKEQESKSKEEKEMLELVANKSQFEDIPDLLINEEINKMILELQRGVEAQGLEFDTYIKNLGKTLAQMKLDFTPQALMRVKVAIVMREIAKQEKIEVDEKELDEELDRIADQYEEAKTKEQVYSPQYRDYMEQILRNRKVIEYLRGIIIK
ncbi:MAG: Trigger factor [Candidatus Uhrbacteria bacterium GW2011_GWF2_39_13]|uniref:Trigger factor n=1 Tax=Candidatus Uhrbacteria bacterium GW2011_GWF2_39_13 TaxID=1618995 RepID=A0A0G0MMD1_9BACT|nr:MAG: Trigger factor [Candidatus Uhrbacteria bacterium GW2011_GWF2_39_13]